MIIFVNFHCTSLDFYMHAFHAFKMQLIISYFNFINLEVISFHISCPTAQSAMGGPFLVGLRHAGLGLRVILESYVLDLVICET